MRNEIELEGIIEDYLNGKLTEAEANAFEQLRLNDPTVDHKVVAHKVFLDSLKDYASNLDLKNKMDHAHDQIDVDALSRKLGPHPSFIVNMWRKNKSAIAVAASFILLTIVTIYSIQQTTEQTGSYKQMSAELSKLKSSTNNLIRDVKSSQNSKVPVKPVKFGGTGFAISSNGYILTSYHVVEKSDTVYVQNNKGDLYKVDITYKDPINDIAILKIIDKKFSLGSLPYSLKKGKVGLGESVYTLGYPKDEVVLGIGYLSSQSGFNGDTLAYQLSLDVNPGNSGGPLLDNSGNVIGIINAKESYTDGATFAVKAKFLQEALSSIPQDSIVGRISSVRKSKLSKLEPSKQVSKIQDYVFMIKGYN
ncbi:trypsin-like peptidase domain-containing protein [Pedobacter panaciterrae]|jgi:Trypsin-like serine proteases, typically periplasmic, contain C-terminal PDZ domain|uniref:S1C family serine protease n=1 Tax=Pedobacter panaciterrae TaxID=363849 RepID=UPI00155DD0FA|nr:serine protease [Pedobacter panaciterrae]NQX52932.1 trypsin-like peptidase domain-containing protein [Pedobacter panaciterrae]